MTEAVCLLTPSHGSIAAIEISTYCRHWKFPPGGAKIHKKNKAQIQGQVSPPVEVSLKTFLISPNSNYFSVLKV